MAGKLPGSGGVELLDPHGDLEAAFSGADADDYGISVQDAVQPPSPEMDLYIALVEDAYKCLILDVIRKDGTVDPVLRRERVRARKWLDGEVESATGCSFAEVCEKTDSDPKVLRRLILKQVEAVLAAREKAAAAKRREGAGRKPAPSAQPKPKVSAAVATRVRDAKPAVASRARRRPARGRATGPNRRR